MNISAQDRVLEFIQLFSSLNFNNLELIVADDIIAHITNREGGIDRVEGKINFIQRLNAMNISDVKITITIPQIVNIKPDLVLAMVEVNAERRGKLLHNFAAHLIQVHENKIKETWMVEALPAYSHEFWL